MLGQAIFSQAIAARSQDLLGRFLLGRLLPPLPFVARRGLDAIERQPDSAQDDALLGRLGSLEVRLATSAAEIRRAQRLRYRIFFEDGPATATFTTRLLRRDADRFDPVCEHLLVIDHASARRARPRGGRHLSPAAPGNRRSDIAASTPRANSTSTTWSRAIRHLKFLELGRSCVLPPYRNKRTVELLWHGIWSYVRRHDLDVMIGCASLDGTDPEALSLPLSFLHHFASAPRGLAGARRCRAPHRHEPDAERRDRSARRLARAAAADQGLSAARRLLRRRRGDRPFVRHHRCADRAAGIGDQRALYRAFRRRCANATRRR